jgi:hypothetical protein
LAIYGAGQLPGSVASQFVIEKFLDDHADYISPAQLAEELRLILHTFYGAGTAAFGVQIAGLENLEKELLPSLYLVSNFSDDPKSLHDFRLTAVRPPKKLALSSDRVLCIGGDKTLYVPMAGALARALESLSRDGRHIPADSLQARREYYASQVRFVSDLYASGRMPRTIGGDVLAMSIDHDGIPFLP